MAGDVRFEIDEDGDGHPQSRLAFIDARRYVPGHEQLVLWSRTEETTGDQIESGSDGEGAIQQLAPSVSSRTAARRYRGRDIAEGYIATAVTTICIALFSILGAGVVSLGVFCLTISSAVTAIRRYAAHCSLHRGPLHRAARFDAVAIAMLPIALATFCISIAWYAVN